MIRFCILPVLLSSSSALAAAPELDLGAILPDPVGNILVKTLGILLDHRPYQGASPRGKSGWDFGVEATLVHLPADLNSSLESVGMSAPSSSSIGALPSAKIHLTRGMSDKVDIGFSGLYYPGILIWGANLKFNLIQPEEGLAWAFRFGYSDTSIDLSKMGFSGLPVDVGGVNIGTANLKVGTQTLSPQIVASKRLTFAEPYIGGGVQWTRGQIEVPVHIDVSGETQTLTTKTYYAYQAMAFTGVNFLLDPLGIRLAFEGAYGHQGMHSLGLLIGFSF